MSKLYLPALTILLLAASCKGNGKAETEEVQQQPEVKLTFDERVERHVTGSLSIPPNEKITIKQYKAHLNADNFEDVIVTVNRLAYAEAQAAKVPSGEQIKAMGYMGNNNYFIFYDGKLDKFSVPIPIASSAKAPLEIKFENIVSASYKDLTIEYRIINSAYKNYYALSGGVLQKVFQVKLFDYLGTDKAEAVFIEYDKGSISSAKDILVYQGKIKNFPAQVDDIYSYTPEVEKQNKLLFRWFFNPRSMQYMTQNTAALREQ